MNELILEAAIRVLEQDGSAAFTTTRVAERAGISVGSLYQYYPNKASLLLRLHEREAQTTWGEIEAILRQVSVPPRVRLARAVQRFLETEVAEVVLRNALRQSEVLFEDSDEFRQIQARAFSEVRAFLRQALPRSGAADLDFRAALVLYLVTGIAERVTSQPLSAAALAKWSATISTMLCRELGL